jgi:twitching motility protein PilJ
MKLWPSKGGREDASGNGKVAVLAVLVVVLLVMALATSRYLETMGGYDEQYLKEAGRQALLSQRIAKEAMTALQGNPAAFGALQRAQTQLAESLNVLQQGNVNLPPVPVELQSSLELLTKRWGQLSKEASGVLAKKDALLAVNEFISVIDSVVPQVQAQLQQTIKILVDRESSQELVAAVGHQLMLVERMRASVQQILLGGDAANDAAARFALDARQFDRVLKAMIKGDPKREIQRVYEPDALVNLTRIDKAFAPIRSNVDDIARVSPELLEGMAGMRAIGQPADLVSEAANDLITELDSAPGRLRVMGVKVNGAMVTLMGAAAVLLLLMMGLILIREARGREMESSQINDRNQRAILRLLDEMGDLADGDLTVEATVTEDITGAIADSVNYAIEALRSLVTGINNAVHKVSTSALESRDNAMKLAEASNQQASQITEISDSIEQMSKSAEGMSKESSQSADVARKAVDAALKGSESVRNTIRGMDEIREQIQETAKRIKRLGESSQEIGDIVELIDDIADQTNILALNAAMQAAMAGEAGRGFAVVADEVQRLAERSGNATKQIEALVKTIQADTNEAVTSMESSTSGVVKVASLAEAAGGSLGEIENVSNFLAKSTDQISKISQIQSSLASEINNGMSTVRSVSERSAEGTSETAHAIGALVDVAEELQQSVAGFRLPE